MTRSLRRLPVVLLGLGAVALLPACADRSTGEAAAPSSSSPSSSAAASGTEPSAEEALQAGLLPAEAFGPDATVVTVNVQQLATTSSGGLPAGATVTPEACAQGVGATQLSVEDYGVVVAQSATSPVGVTVEVLAESDRIENGGAASGQAESGAAGFDELLAQCRQVTVTGADGSTATVDFAPLEVPALGDASDGLSFTTAVRASDGTAITVPSLLAMATDGQRVVFLQQTGGSSAPLDQAAFTALFEEAFAAQQDS